ncbi:MAG: hypothetical protein JG762_835 [Deferribacteraceae bacterium]|jgi:prepilin-type N-terminal cleavage/methylation domain-containing protein|nr:hypothetical protein [Deferribacteraceae bacterium]
MARKVNIRKGVSLIELLVVIAIIGILLGIGIYNYNKWVKKQEVEQTIKDIYGLLEKYRTRAYTSKQEYKIKVSDYKITVEGTDAEYNSKYKIFGSDMDVDFRGVFNIKNTLYVENKFDALYDCIIINGYKLRLGSGGASCEVK